LTMKDKGFKKVVSFLHMTVLNWKSTLSIFSCIKSLWVKGWLNEWMIIDTLEQQAWNECMHTKYVTICNPIKWVLL
jgi:hypothetical protein